MRARSSFCGLLSIRKALLLAQVIGQSIKEPGAIEIKAVKEDSGGRESTPAKVVIATRRVQSPARCTNRSKRVKSDWSLRISRRSLPRMDLRSLVFRLLHLPVQ